MSTDQLSLFFALLALGAVAVAAATVVATFTGGRRGRFGELRVGLIGLGGLIAATSTAGSLYYSEIAHYTPCELCWYQRIAMYPLTILLATAALRRDLKIAIYAVPPAAVGALISVYHYQLQVFPDQGSSCDLEAPCTQRWVEQLGFVSIPFMALCGFVAIVALTVAAATWGDDRTPHTPEVDQ